MRPPIPIPEHRIEELKNFQKNKWDDSCELQRFLCVWLRIAQKMSTQEIARAVGWHVNTVRRTQRDFIANGTMAFGEEKRGGRRHQLMTFEEETRFLAPFAERAGDASMLVANEIKEEFEKQLGRTVHKTTVYRILRRHGWRKITPRTKHPKQNKEVVEAFKKGASLTG